MATVQRSTDPTRAATRRNRFARAYSTRWRTVRGEIRTQIRNTRRFHPLADVPPSRQIAEFREWIDTTLEADVLEPLPHAAIRRGRHPSAVFVRDLYRHGIAEADRRLRAGGVDVAYRSDAFQRDFADEPEQAIDRAPHDERLETAYIETYHDLEDITHAVETDVSRSYRDSVRDGIAVGVLIGLLNTRVNAIGQTRTNTLAETRGVKIINEAALERYHEFGVAEVGLDIELRTDGGEPIDPDRMDAKTWITAGDDRVCPECAAYAGLTFSIQAMRAGDEPMPPIHANCRCYLIPAVI